MTHVDTCPRSQVNTVGGKGDPTHAHTDLAKGWLIGFSGLNTRQDGEKYSRSNCYSLNWKLTLGCPSGVYIQQGEWTCVNATRWCSFWPYCEDSFFWPDPIFNNSRVTDLKSNTDTLLNPGSPSRASSIWKDKKDQALQTSLSYSLFLILTPLQRTHLAK